MKARGLAKLSKNARTALKDSYSIAKSSGSALVDIPHLFVALSQNKTFLSAQILAMFDANFAEISQKVLSINADGVKSFSVLELSPDIRKTLQLAYEIASKHSHVYVGTEHLLLAMLSLENNAFVNALSKVGVNKKTVEERLSSFATYPPGVFSSGNQPNFEEESSGVLDSFGRDLTELASEGRLMPLVGREKEISRMIGILSRKTKNNPVVIGESGVGKTAVVEGLAQRIASGNVPSSLSTKRIISIDTASLVAGSKIRGELEERVLGIISEARQNPDVILFIDEIHSILGAGAISNGAPDIADMLKPALANGELHCIGATTFDAYQHIFEEDSTLSRRFQPVVVKELSLKQTITVLEGIKHIFEEFHGVTIRSQALEEAVSLSIRYLHDRFLPDKAIDLIDEACARKKLREERTKKKVDNKVESRLQEILEDKYVALETGDYEKALKLRTEASVLIRKLESYAKKYKKGKSRKRKVFVTVEDVRQVVSDWADVPMSVLSKSDFDSLYSIDNVLRKFIIGQEEAIESVVKALRRAHIGIADEDRPLSSLLFLGPTGVGKSELARVVARELFGSKENLIQIDMSELMEQHSVSKLIGSPPGYVGYQNGGLLTDKVRRNPYSVVLFDEIEKAHPDVLNLLLQILEYGQLTDSKGRITSFRNTIIILTSNIGADEIFQNKFLGFGEIPVNSKSSDSEYNRMQDTLREELKNELSPEFLNRLDDIVIFRALTLDDAIKISKILVKQLTHRLEKRGIKIKASSSIYKYIANNGFDKEYGARPIRRFIQDNIESMIADYIIENKIEDGSDVSLKIIKEGDSLKVTS